MSGANLVNEINIQAKSDHKTSETAKKLNSLWCEILAKIPTVAESSQKLL